MPPIEKENGNSLTAARAPRSSPVCLEVPVTVRGAVQDETTNQTESFSESTRTVLVFAGAAVLRLSAHVTPGQTVMLMNEHTKKEVRCEVLKSKSQGLGLGVYELEFSDPDENFWGMTFPGERPARAAGRAPLPQAQPEQKISAPPANLPLGVAPPVVSSYSGQAEVTAFADAPANPPAPVSPVLPAPPVQAAPVPDGPAWPLENRPLVKKDSQLDAAPAPTAPEPLPAPPVAPPILPQEAAPARLETPEESIEPASVRFAANRTPAPAPAPASFEPSLDKPLEFGLAPEPPKTKSQPAAQEASSDSVALPDFLKPQSTARKSLPEIAYVPSAGSRAASFLLRVSPVVLIVLAVAGGGWYLWNRPGRAAWLSSLFAPKPAAVAASHSRASGEPAPAPPAQPAQAAAASFPPAPSTSYYSPAPQSPRKPAEEAEQPGFSLPSAPSSSSPSQPDAPHSAAISSAPLFSGTDNPGHLPIPADSSLASLAASSPAPISTRPPQPPPVAPGGMAPVTSAALPETGKSPKPSGPTRPARLVSSVSPEYPPLARSQRVSGDVLVDAKIDETGKVSAVKIISGNALLQGAAMDALRKWRYQPALQNGQPVIAHLQVTIRFRLEK